MDSDDVSIFWNQLRNLSASRLGERSGVNSGLFGGGRWCPTPSQSFLYKHGTVCITESFLVDVVISCSRETQASQDKYFNLSLS